MLNWLEKNNGSSECEKWDIHPKYSTILEGRKKNYSFTVVRNPWDRMVSMYHYFKNVAMYENSRFLALNNLTTDNFPTFDEWVFMLDKVDVPPDYWFTGQTPQVDWLDSPVDLIIRYENLNEEFLVIQEIMKCPTPLPHIYSSGRSNYKDYYNDATRKEVERISEKDIDTWKYSY
jgi:hypothetical protein